MFWLLQIGKHEDASLKYPKFLAVEKDWCFFKFFNEGSQPRKNITAIVDQIKQPQKIGQGKTSKTPQLQWVPKKIATSWCIFWYNFFGC